MRFTPVRCYVLLDLVAEGKLSITRNGALEPSIDGYGAASPHHPFTEERMLTAVDDLRKAGMIKFAETALFGTYIGKAKLTPWGDSQLIRARDAQQAYAKLAERHAAERAAFEQKRAEELAAFKEANQVLKSDEDDDADQFQRQPAWAADRVRAFLDRHAERNIAEKAIIFRVDDHVLHAGDLALLCDTVLDVQAPKVEPYTDGHDDGKLYLTREQAGTLVDLFRTYFPADFENYETGRYVKSLTATLASFAKGKR